jgi:hypothetical protein
VFYPLYALKTRLSGSQTPVWTLWRSETLLPLPRTECRFLGGQDCSPHYIYWDMTTRRKIKSAVYLFPRICDITVTWGQVSEQAWLAINIGNSAAEFQGHYTTNIYKKIPTCLTRSCRVHTNMQHRCLQLDSCSLDSVFKTEHELQ